VLHTLFQEAIGQIRAPVVCAVVNPRHLYSRNLRNYGQRGTAEFRGEGGGKKEEDLDPELNHRSSATRVRC
jgi:hypothetical protein